MTDLKTPAKLFNRDFTMVIIGQVISLFGNAVLRLVLPLYLLNQTHSAALFGVVSALSFIPMIILAPIGGIIADRINKRNIMVILDFSTSALTLIFTMLLGKLDLVVLIITTLIILYAIQGTYSPAVQASIPVLVPSDKLVPGNSAITLVSSLSGLIGPVLGGTVFGLYGIKPVLIVSILCFFASAVMEIFIHIPFKKQPNGGSIFAIAKNDTRESLSFIKNERPIIAQVAIYVSLINLVFSALLIIGMPVIITQKLGFATDFGNQLYSYCEGTMAAGGLLGGLLSGILSKKLSIKRSYILLFVCTLFLVPIGIVMLLKLPPMISYIIIIISCFFMMIASTIFSIEMLAYCQLITPTNLIGKVMAIGMFLVMCATPIGQALYGWLIDVLSDKIYIVFFASAVVSSIIAFFAKCSLDKLEEPEKEQNLKPTEEAI